MTLEEKIYSFEEENTIIGISDATPFYSIKPILEKSDIPFVEKDIEKRINPMLIRSDAKSIIALGLSYNKTFVGDIDNKIRGKISIGAMGLDYHILVKEKLENIKNSLKIEGDIFVDTGPLVDREVAKRCGLGIAGKSGNIINKKLGSIFFIGYMVTNVQLKPTINTYTDDLCKNCDKCIKACPSGAILENGFNYKVCISYLTQKKELESEEEKKLINRQIYGCDICQKVCPYNKEVYKEEICDVDTFYPNIKEILNMTNKQFESTYKKTACGWRGKKILQRNAIIALANYKYSEKAIEILEKMKNDTREDIKNYALWAIDKLNNKR
ncbi:tRNA epoxyqueuosine(34) reductase QueG [[Clostridium] colinum]|uniref:tRNA epoxyqueuosine(34) reductase QueG n=1 Tax=[Clostridium] colinum TaxID=36835 RepID=UPI002023EC9D|nr:tRNA epoxyqueuosine(34) reductase QueG [[Clostridium] colinum]